MFKMTYHGRGWEIYLLGSYLNVDAEIEGGLNVDNQKEEKYRALERKNDTWVNKEGSL